MITEPTSYAIKYTVDDSDLVKDESISFLSTETTRTDFRDFYQKVRIYWRRFKSNTGFDSVRIYPIYKSLRL